MNELLRTILGLIGILHTGDCLAYEAERDLLLVKTSAPPAAIVVLDSSGRRSGADEDAPISPDGRGNVINEIPTTDVDHYLLDDDERPDAEPAPAFWGVSLMDGGDQTYRVRILGIAPGFCKVYVSAGKPAQGIVRPFATTVLVDSGIVRELRITFSPTGNFTTTVERVVRASDLLADVQIACKLGAIAPQGVCESLETKVRAVVANLVRDDTRAAVAVLSAFRHDLDAQAGKHVAESAVAVLRSDLDALRIEEKHASRRDAGSSAHTGESR